MKFTNLIAVLAISAFAANASAYSDGTLRRSTSPDVVAQNDSTTTSKEVNININTNAAQAQQAQPGVSAQPQPVTVVEAAPATESKAEALRKARQEAEVNTEQKIVEKLEDSRLQEERARADRLFGNKLDPQPAPTPAPAPAPVVVQPVAPAPAPAPAPVVDNKPAQVNIEKVEIIEPPKPVEVKETKIEPVPETKLEVKEEKKDEAPAQQWYAGALAGNLQYSANNVKSNYGLGLEVGTIIDNRWGIELAYMYSNHNVSDLWSGYLWHKLDQNDIAAKAKYYILEGKLKPYVGASVTYINRKYSEMFGYSGSSSYNLGQEASTNALDMGVIVGVDFEISKSIMIGAGFDYNFNVMNFNDMNYNSYSSYNPYGYQQYQNVKPLEQINYYTMAVTAKFLF